MFVKVTVQRAPVAPATGGSAVIPTPDTAVGPVVSAAFALTGERSELVDTPTG